MKLLLITIITLASSGSTDPTTKTNTLDAAIQEIASDMVGIKGGEFSMGCTTEQGDDCYGDEKPAHKVSVNDFRISRVEVTQKQYKAIMGYNPSRLSNGCGNCPVESVSWEDAQKFIRKLNTKTGLEYRLPTEAEWEYAARGGNKSKRYKYSGSDDLTKVGWFDNNSSEVSNTVGLLKPNELGLYDMSGNVWEWCNDWYGDTYYETSTNNNPIGMPRGKFRVLRGGSLSHESRNCRVSFRYWFSPSLKKGHYGFRLAQSLGVSSNLDP